MMARVARSRATSRSVPVCSGLGGVGWAGCLLGGYWPWQNRGAVVVKGGSSRARESRSAAPAASPRATASPAASRKSATASGGGRLGVHDLGGDLASGGSALAQDRSREAVQRLAFRGRKLAVDRRAQDGMGEAGGGAGVNNRCMRRSIVGRSRVAAQCSGVDVGGCARCANRGSRRRWPAQDISSAERPGASVRNEYARPVLVCNSTERTRRETQDDPYRAQRRGAGRGP